MSPNPARPFLRVFALGVVLAMMLAVMASLSFSIDADAQPAPVGLGTAASYAVLGGSEVTNTGPTVVNGDLGVQPGSTAPGFPPGIVNGTIHLADAAALQAQSDLTIAYDDAAGRACDTDLTDQDLGGLTLTPGVYCFSSSAQLTGTLTLDAQGNPDAPFIFQIASQITTAPNSTVALIGATQSCNVFWQVGTTAALDTNTTFRGTIMALASITVNDASTIDGRALARNAEVTFINDTITRADCAEPEPTPTPSPSDDGSPSDGATPDDGSSPDDGASPDDGDTGGDSDTGTDDGTDDGSDDGDGAGLGGADADGVVVTPANRIETGGGGTAAGTGWQAAVVLVLVLGAATTTLAVRHRRAGVDRG